MTLRTVAVPIGDPNGVGPEIAVKAAAALAAKDGTVRAVLVGDIDVVAHYVAQIAPGFALRPVDRVTAPVPGMIDLVPVGALPARHFAPGKVDAAAGAATLAYVDAAVDLVRRGEAAAIVAAPHNETAVNASGRAFSGYPALLAELTGTPSDRVFLMLVGGGLRIVHTTLHERLHDALLRLTPDLVAAAARAAAAALAALGIAAPRLGLFGINPHAGEGGLFGRDDDEITVPAAQRLKAEGFAVDGPIGADVLLAARAMDAYVAMYHDQGHIPIKLVAGRDSAAISIGAGVMFSSVGHGSAFDIAGRGVADAAPLLRTLRLVAGAVAS
jgi:4-hydroxythreonine-4-phosphate dehydrogenase